MYIVFHFMCLHALLFGCVWNNFYLLYQASLIPRSQEARLISRPLQHLESICMYVRVCYNVYPSSALLLFAHVPLLCLSLPSANSDFQVCEGDNYSCKWFSPLSKLEVVETDYHHDIWDYIVARGQRSNILQSVHVKYLKFSQWINSYVFDMYD